MKKKQESGTSVRLADEIKPWIYRKMQVENRSLGNIINTCLKREKEREEKEKKIEDNMHQWAIVLTNE